MFLLKKMKLFQVGQDFDPRVKAVNVEVNTEVNVTEVNVHRSECRSETVVNTEVNTYVLRVASSIRC